MSELGLLDLEPTTISRDLKNKFILIYSLPKVGKTSFAAQFPKNLLLAFEKGYNAIAGIYAKDIPNWKEFKKVLKELRDPRVQEKFDSITFDTIGIAWDLCEKYICAQNQVTEIGEIPYGKGYKLCTEEFQNSLRELTILGYGLIIISHSEEKPIKAGSDETEIRPAVPKRAYEVVNRIVDIIGYIGVDYDEDGNSTRTLYTRSRPGLVAGSRFQYMKDKIPFGYNELVGALADAIEEAGAHGATLTDLRHNQFVEDDTKGYDFAALMEKARSLWFVARDKERIDAAMDIIEKNFGRKMKLSEATEEQSDLLELAIADLEELVK